MAKNKVDIKSKVIRRYTFVVVLILILFLAVLFRVVSLKVTKGEYYTEIQQDHSRKTVSIEASRGNILSDNGSILACSVPSYKIYMDPLAAGITDKIFRDNIDSLSICLSKFYRDKSAAKYKQMLVKARKNNRRYVRLNTRSINYLDLVEFQQFPLFRLGRNKGGFIVVKTETRDHPFGMLAKRTVGRVYGERDKGGELGLEESFNQELKGINGLEHKVRLSGQWIPEESVAPVDGKDIKSTINVALQDVSEQALLKQLQKYGGDYGCAVVMEVETGKVKAVANFARTYSGYYSQGLFNHAVGTASEPGSTFKLASFMVALEDGVVNLNDSIDTGNGVYRYYDRNMRDSHYGGFGKISYRQVFEKSSNVGTSRLIYDNYKDMPEHYIDRLYAMGLNVKNGISIKGEGVPQIKYPSSESWSGVSLPWMSIGYELKVTPLQTLAFYNAVANNGKLMRPYFVSGVYMHGELLKSYEPQVINPSICSSSTIQQARSLLEGVVERGTASNIKSSKYKIAGKTGTTQVAKGSSGYRSGTTEYQASFCGYFPAEKPKYSCIVLIKGLSSKGYYGNVVAGSVFKEISDWLYAYDFGKPQVKDTANMIYPYSKGGNVDNLLQVLNDLDVPHSEVNTDGEWLSASASNTGVALKSKQYFSGLMPNVKGLGAMDAVSLLENMGMKVIISGRGRVSYQSVKEGSIIKKGAVVKLNLET